MPHPLPGRAVLLPSIPSLGSSGLPVCSLPIGSFCFPGWRFQPLSLGMIPSAGRSFWILFLAHLEQQPQASPPSVSLASRLMMIPYSPMAGTATGAPASSSPAGPRCFRASLFSEIGPGNGRRLEPIRLLSPGIRSLASGGRPTIPIPFPFVTRAFSRPSGSCFSASPCLNGRFLSSIRSGLFSTRVAHPLEQRKALLARDGA